MLHLVSASTCIACDRSPSLDDALLCRHCAHALAADLRAIASGFPLLDPAPATAPMAASGGRNISFGSRSPARDDVLSLTDPRPAAWDSDAAEKRAGSVVGLVRHWVGALVVDGVLDEVDVRRRSFVGAADGTVRVVRGRPTAADAWRLHRLAVDGALDAYWGVGELARHAAVAARAMRRALGDERPRIVVGRCPQTLASGAPCGGALRTLGWGHPVRCAACGARWTGDDDLRALAGQLGGAMLDMPGLVRFLGMDGREATLRKWAQRDGWRRERVGRSRTVYALDDALASWWRAHDRILADAAPAAA